MPNLADRYKTAQEKLESYQRSTLIAPAVEKRFQDRLDVLWRSMTEHERLEINRWAQRRKHT